MLLLLLMLLLMHMHREECTLQENRLIDCYGGMEVHSGRFSGEAEGAAAPCQNCFFLKKLVFVTEKCETVPPVEKIVFWD